MRRSIGLPRSTKQLPAWALSQVASLSTLIISRGIVVRKPSSPNLCSSALNFTGRRSKQQATDPVDVQGRKHEVPIDGMSSVLEAKVEIWDATRGSNDSE